MPLRRADQKRRSAAARARAGVRPGDSRARAGPAPGLSPVIWIGGAPGAGKTTLAARLMRRHGLRLYSSDTRTWLHRDRAIAAGNAAAQRWEALPPGERGDRPAGELIAMSLHHERGAMVVEDVLALPAGPLIVAEGSVITPASLPPGARAVWLLQREPDARGNPLYELLAREIENDIRATEVPVLAIDGIEETVAAVEELFRDVLVAGPRAVNREERKALLREANLARVEQVRGFYARPWANGDPEVVEHLFLCECGDPACVADLRRAVAAAASGPLLAPGH